MDWWKKVRMWFARTPQVSPEKTLLQAVKDGDVLRVQELLAGDRAHEQISALDRGMALFLAAHCEHTAVAEALLSAGGDRLIDQRSITKAINIAAIGGNIAIIDLLARDYPDHFKGEEAAKALRRAAEVGNSVAVLALVRGGTPPDLRVGHHPTALLAAASRDPACVAALLEAGADVHEVDYHGRTALHHAAAASQDKCVLLLLCAGAVPSARDHKGGLAIDLTPSEYVRSLLSPLRHLLPENKAEDNEKAGVTPTDGSLAQATQK